jgi:transposase
MAKRYRPVNRDQAFLLPPDVRDWLPAQHPVWLVIEAVERHLDTAAFHALRRTGGAGAAGYDPDMLVTVLTWAYARQVTSSRRIEELCRTDVAFRVICAGHTPDHVTFSEFRRAFPGAMEEFFAGVLALCARLGMGRLGVVALDGMKIAANASKPANRTEDKLRELAAATVARHGETDQAEDALFGAGARGDEVPGACWSPRRRAQRIAAALASLQAERTAAAAEREALARACVEPARAGTPRTGRHPAEAAVELARLNLEKVTAAQQAQIDDWQARDLAARAAGGKGLRNRPRSPASEHCRVKAAAARLGKAQAAAAQARPPAGQKKGKDGQPVQPVRNITDPDARLMPVRGGGFIEGCNAQNVTSADGLLIATELTGDPAGTAWFEPMLRAAEDAAAFITAHQPASTTPDATAAGAGSPAAAGEHAAAAENDAPAAARQPAPGGQASLIKLFLSDAGYLSEHNLTLPGPDRLIATGKHRTLERAARGDGQERPPASAAITAMTARLATEDGITAYRQRSHIAETPHGNIKHNMRFRQLSVRGKPKAAAEWKFTCAARNLFKAITTGHLTAAALQALASQPG